MNTLSLLRKTTPAVALFTTLLGIWYLSDLNTYINLETLFEHSSKIKDIIASNRLGAAILFFVLYTMFAAACLPGISILTFGAGLFFDFTTGTFICSFASTLGASIAFFIARHLIRDTLQSDLGTVLQKLNEELVLNGKFYILFIRLVPIFPFQVINLALGLSKIRFQDFYIYSQIGMLPATAVLTNAGSRVSEIQSMNDIFTPPILWALILMASLPILARLLKIIRKSR